MGKRVNMKLMQDVTDKEIDTLITGLKKIKGFDFLLDSIIILQAHPKPDL